MEMDTQKNVARTHKSVVVKWLGLLIFKGLAKAEIRSCVCEVGYMMVMVIMSIKIVRRKISDTAGVWEDHK